MAISIPSTEVGEYRGILFFEDEKTHSQALEGSSGTNASIIIKQRLGVTTYIFKGNIHLDLKLKNFQLQQEKDKLKTTIALENQGQRHYRGTGSIYFPYGIPYLESSRLFVKFIVNDVVDLVVLPNAERSIQSSYCPTMM